MDTRQEGIAVEERDNTMSAVEPDKPESESVLSEEELNETIVQLCRSKAEEFRLIGYEQVTGEDVWECVSDKYHKKGVPPLYEIVNDILSLKVTQFMNFITLNMYRGEFRK
ncbi:post-transcriptional regulator [Cohnella hongkongensis]|uniref:Post-transcriptional regulator n=1 Tax=Cohnella hongkongensis TaxID=178337 RepID=A0ABV9FF82_9BACL